MLHLVPSADLRVQSPEVLSLGDASSPYLLKRLICGPHGNGRDEPVTAGYRDEQRQTVAKWPEPTTDSAMPTTPPTTATGLAITGAKPLAR